ncbi:hypothetical protein K505DRAFT_356978 [Melanomma pulvis-pyrius CBS 109.77]|uniref:Uncharacterized protein n=1 Tax=Melanomma pulvis-pyrius CBS 109.77 TaxID=1314802 RepID=A0A6A6XRE3_9PLEO|nr:hypothetical protein K505DRAFT_356978 [Melanomma pulvis-pyrius CBS 109.77]
MGLVVPPCQLPDYVYEINMSRSNSENMNFGPATPITARDIQTCFGCLEELIRPHTFANSFLVEDSSDQDDSPEGPALHTLVDLDNTERKLRRKRVLNLPAIPRSAQRKRRILSPLDMTPVTVIRGFISPQGPPNRGPTYPLLSPPELSSLLLQAPTHSLSLPSLCLSTPELLSPYIPFPLPTSSSKNPSSIDNSGFGDNPSSSENASSLEEVGSSEKSDSGKHSGYRVAISSTSGVVLGMRQLGGDILRLRGGAGEEAEHDLRYNAGEATSQSLDAPKPTTHRSVTYAYGPLTPNHKHLIPKHEDLGGYLNDEDSAKYVHESDHEYEYVYNKHKETRRQSYQDSWTLIKRKIDYEKRHKCYQRLADYVCDHTHSDGVYTEVECPGVTKKRAKGMRFQWSGDNKDKNWRCDILEKNGEFARQWKGRKGHEEGKQ